MRSIPQDSPTLFDGKVCAKCGTWQLFDNFYHDKAKSDGRASYCRICKLASHEQWRKANLEKDRIAHRVGYVRVKDRPLSPTKQCARCKQEKPRTDFYASKYARDGRVSYCPSCSLEKVREQNRKRPDLLKARIARYAEKHPDIQRITDQRRRARELAAPGTHTIHEWEALRTWFGNACLVCGMHEGLEQDHVIPLTKGGSNGIENIQPLCRSCNAQKSTKTTDYRDPKHLQAFLDSLGLRGNA